MKYILVILGCFIFTANLGICRAEEDYYLEDGEYEYGDYGDYGGYDQGYDQNTATELNAYDYETYQNDAAPVPAPGAQPTIQPTDDTDVDCSIKTVSIDYGDSSLAVGGFDIAGIMLGMNFEDAMYAARTSGLYSNRKKNSVIYSIHPEWKYNLDYECRRQNIFVPSELERCINSLARRRGVLYASELHLVRESTGETIDVFFTSNATDNRVWKIIYKNDADQQDGDDEKFANQRDKKILTWWRGVLDKYGAPNSGASIWATSDNAFDPMMTAYFGELDLIDCGRHTEDSSMNIRQSQDYFAAKPYAF